MKPGRLPSKRTVVTPRAPVAAPTPPPVAGKNAGGSRLLVEIPHGWTLAGAHFRAGQERSIIEKLFDIRITSEYYIRAKDLEKEDPSQVIITQELRRILSATPVGILENALESYAENCDYGRATEPHGNDHEFGIKLVGFYTCTRNPADGRGTLAAVIVIETKLKFYIVHRIQRAIPFRGQSIPKAAEFYDKWTDWIADISVGDEKGQRPQ